MENSLKSNAKKYGTVTFAGAEYVLRQYAYLTGRKIPGQDVVADGEPYDFEMRAAAHDVRGNEVSVYWVFTGIKGPDDPELDSYDYAHVDRVDA